jgi:hypothetical protein
MQKFAFTRGGMQFVVMMFASHNVAYTVNHTGTGEQTHRGTFMHDGAMKDGLDLRCSVIEHWRKFGLKCGN